jgi:hypothetical protein
MWQRRTVCRSWWATKRAQISRLKPSTSENSQTFRTAPGSSSKITSNWAKSTAAFAGAGSGPGPPAGSRSGPRMRVSATVAPRAGNRSPRCKRRHSRARGSRATAGCRSGPDRRSRAAADTPGRAQAAALAACAVHRPEAPDRVRCICVPSCGRSRPDARSPRRSTPVGEDPRS